MRRPSAVRLARLVADQDTRELTYAEHGATAGRMPGGYRHDRWEADLGRYDEAEFTRLADAIGHWRVQLGAGMSVYPAEPVRPGLTFALTLRVPGCWVTVAGRVVYLTSEPGRRGFGYGTLPGHPERGEEAFHLVRDGSRMLLEVVAFSRQAHPLARLGAPAARALQVRTTKAYLAGMRTAAAERQ